MDTFVAAVLLVLVAVAGFGAGSVWTLSQVRAGRFEDEGYSYSYFRNVRKRSRLGRC